LRVQQNWRREVTDICGSVTSNYSLPRMLLNLNAPTDIPA
jgi:hypothetical protein